VTAGRADDICARNDMSVVNRVSGVCDSDAVSRHAFGRPSGLGANHFIIFHVASAASNARQWLEVCCRCDEQTQRLLKHPPPRQHALRRHAHLRHKIRVYCVKQPAMVVTRRAPAAPVPTSRTPSSQAVPRVKPKVPAGTTPEVSSPLANGTSKATVDSSDVSHSHDDSVSALCSSLWPT
jgi:hypothetical protein